QGFPMANTTTHLQPTIVAILARGKGILAADETVPTIESRFKALDIVSTPENRRAYREMLLFHQTRCIEADHYPANHDDSYSGRHYGSLLYIALLVCDRNACTAGVCSKELSHFEPRRIAAIRVYCRKSPTEPVRTALRCGNSNAIRI